MSDTNSSEKIHRRVRTLTVAVWCIGALTVANLYMAVFGRHYSHVEGGRYEGEVIIERNGNAVDFKGLPLSKKVAAADTIALVKFVPDGDILRCTVSELLKSGAAVKAQVKVGAEVLECDMHRSPGVDYGDGAMAFFAGDPPMFVYSTSLHNGELWTEGGRSVESVRKMIQAGMH